MIIHIRLFTGDDKPVHAGIGHDKVPDNISTGITEVSDRNPGI